MTTVTHDLPPAPVQVQPGLGWPARPRPVTSALGWPLPATDSDGTGTANDDSTSNDDDPSPAAAPGETSLAPESTTDVSRETDVEQDATEVSRETPPPPVPAEAPRLAQALADEGRRRHQLSSRQVSRPTSTRVFTVANQKGGVGKTTSAVNLAAALGQSGMNVLVIDMDPQGNASTALGIPHQAGTMGVYDVLIDGVALGEVVKPSSSVPRVSCAPATIDLAGAEIELVPLVAREARLRKALHTHLESIADDQRYDYVFIDCPPSLGLLTVNAFVAADEVLIPIQCEYYALEGLSQLLTNIEMIREHLNPTLRVSSILLTMYDARTRLSAQVADEVRAHFPDQVLSTTIPRSVRISEAPSHGETVITYDPGSTGALCYLEAAVELAQTKERNPA